MYLEFKWLSIIAFNCSQWRSLPVSAGGWEALLILSDFLAYMMSSMRVIVKARTLHSDACHREQSHTTPTLWQRAGTDSRIPHADWPKSKFTAWQSRIHLVATWSHNERGPLSKHGHFSSCEFTSSTEQSFRESKEGPTSRDHWGAAEPPCGSCCSEDWLTTKSQVSGGAGKLWPKFSSDPH